MSQTVTIELNDETFAALAQQAEAVGQTPADRLRTLAEREAGSANGAAARLSQTSGDDIQARIERYYPGVFGPPDTRTEAEKREATEAFRKLIGSVDMGHPIGADNEQIDADLAREYMDDHEAD